MIFPSTHSQTSNALNGDIPLEERLSDREYEFIAKLVAENTGIILNGERHRNMIYGRLIRRLRALHLSTFSEYCNLLKSAEGADEMNHLINAVTTNVTAFFRENHHFEHLKEYLRTYAANSGSKRLRLWSAACSSGEEPYSIAMTACDAIPAIASWDAKILATDIDTAILDRASQGVYSNSFLKDISPAYTQRYIESAEKPDQFHIKESVQKLIAFKQLNLLEQWKMKGPFDVIFCRNVFIYFTQETVREITLRFASLLKMDGMLYIGHSENLLNMGDIFAHEGKTIYRKVGHGK